MGIAERGETERKTHRDNEVNRQTIKSQKTYNDRATENERALEPIAESTRMVQF